MFRCRRIDERAALFVVPLLVVMTTSLVADVGPPVGVASQPAGSFHAPRAIVDQHGQVILTRRAVGHPAVVDFNKDGLPDIAVGCHQSMDTVRAEVLLLQNVGTKAKPRFKWPDAPTVKVDGGNTFQPSCGCKSGGTFELHPVDCNGDGNVDLVVDTFWHRGVEVLLNSGKSTVLPTFTRHARLHDISSHGIGSGGGDWNGDGVEDYVHRVNGHGWQVHAGTRDAAGAVKFAEKPSMVSKDFTMTGHEDYPPVRGRQRWFDHSPYAWNFSGRHDPGSDIVEIVAVMEDPLNKQRRSYAEHQCHINCYWLNRATKACTFKARLAINHAAHTRMSIGDLNADGAMDLLYSGGVFTKGDETKIWVMFGRNVERALPTKEQ
jgi:hypothetical protein